MKIDPWLRNRGGYRSVLCLLAALPSLPLGIPSIPAASAERQASAAIRKLALEKFTLANGMQVILHVDRRLPLVCVNMWVHAGSKNEQPGHEGFAHLFEHLMFQGSANAPGNPKTQWANPKPWCRSGGKARKARVTL